MRTILCLFFTLLAYSPAMFAQTWISLNAGGNELKGFIQTPKGGAVGTTSYHRPSFNEMELKRDLFFDIHAGTTWKSYFAKLEYRRLSPDGAHVLDEALTTHSQFIPQGDPFHIKAVFDWYQLGIGKHVTIDSNWTFAPLVDLHWIQYEYSFFAPSARSSRAFSMTTPTLGAKIRYSFLKGSSVDVEAKSSIGLTNLELYSLVVGVNQVLDLTSKVQIMPRLALGYYQIHFKDNQFIPNEILYKAQPNLSLGLTIVLDRPLI